MRNVMIVVQVLMMSCQVSLEWKIGPVIPQTTMSRTARMKTRGRPEKFAAALARREYQDRPFIAHPLYARRAIDALAAPDDDRRAVRHENGAGRRCEHP